MKSWTRWKAFLKCLLGVVLALTMLVGTFTLFAQYIIGVLAIMALCMILVISASQGV